MRTMNAAQIAQAEAALSRYYAAREQRDAARRQRDDKLARAIVGLAGLFACVSALNIGAALAGIGA